MEHRRTFQSCYARVDQDMQKNKLAKSSGGYRNPAGYKKVNQSTSNIQMSSTLSNFSSAQGLNPKRVKMANATEYEKTVLKGRQNTQKRMEAKYNPSKWNFTSEGLWDNLTGGPIHAESNKKGMTGNNVKVGNPRRQKLVDMSSSIQF